MCKLKYEYDVSIIVPVYNVEQYLKKCVDSILNEKKINIEVILVNDGSKDNSGKICDEFKIIDSRVKVIHKKNGGLSSARNVGLDVARGKYIIFVDSDDYIDQNMISILYSEIKDSKFDLVYCEFEKVFDKDIVNFINKRNNTYDKLVYSQEEAFNKLILYKNVELVIAWNKIYKKEIFDGLRYTEGKLHEDEFIIHHILSKVKYIKKICIPLYYYIQRDNSITFKLSEKRILDTLEAFDDRIRLIDEMNIIKSLKERYHYWILEQYKNYYYLVLFNRDFKKLKKLIKKRYDLYFYENEVIDFSHKLFKVSPFAYRVYLKLKKII